jgi:hypothetical protein
MVDKHEPEIPVALETLVTRLGDLEIVLGKHVGPELTAIRNSLTAAMAARDRGDAPGAIEHIGRAMDRLTGLADQLDPTEAVFMRALAHGFRTALLRGDHDHVQRTTAVMLERSGAVQRKKSD